MRKRDVRIVSIDNRYMKESYKAVAVYDESVGNYITGQHYDFTDPTTSPETHLTKEELEGVVKISDEKRKRYPYIIMAEDRIPIIHLSRLNVGIRDDGSPENFKDFTLYEFIKRQNSIVSLNKLKIVTGQHYFYFEDKEAEANVKVSNFKLKFQAQQLINENCSIANQSNIALLLNYKVEGLNINPKILSPARLEEALYDAIDKYPEKVISCFDKKAKDELFILKSVYYNAIQKNGKSFTDGDIFIGDTIEDVLAFIKTKEGSIASSKWMRIIAKAENTNVNDIDFAKESQFKELLLKAGMAIVDDKDGDATIYIEQASKLGFNDNDDLIRLKEKLTKLKESKLNKKSSSKDSDDKINNIK